MQTWIEALAMRTNAPSTAVCFALATSLLSGCSTLITYRPQTAGESQSLKYVQGVGTLTMKNDDHEIFMYPTFKTQGPSQPTFTIGYANNSSSSVNFTTDNVKAFFRGMPVPIYSYTEKIAEIQSEKSGKQIALAILGGVAAGAAAYGASHQTYKTNYSGSVWTRHSSVGFAGSNTLRVYDPMSGILAGAAVGGVTGLGVRQLEYNAKNQEQAANSILQANSVEPRQMVTGDLILKNCCDPYSNGKDVIRFEVTVNNRLSVFEFVRVSSDAPGVMVAPTMVSAHQPSAATVPLVSPPMSVAPKALPVALNEQAGNVSASVVPRQQLQAQPAALPEVVLPSGEYTANAERLARTFSCGATPKFVAKGGGFETYSIACRSADPVMLRCDSASCHEMK